MLDIPNIRESGLCCGCGACAYYAPEAIEMVDAPLHGRRPELKTAGRQSGELTEAARVCPGVGLAHETASSQSACIQQLLPAWGPVLDVWEGYAVDPELRYAGASGGAATALALYCLEAAGMEQVVHTAASEDKPHLNRTVVSRTREDLLRTTGSRYSPASPCEGLANIESAKGQCLFVGKPCDVAASRKARNLRPALDQHLGLTIGFFCAGTPSTRGTLEMLKCMGIEDIDSLVSLRYRGNGWPGHATAVLRNQSGMEESRSLTYEHAWGEILSRHQQWRCKLCADHTAEFADIAVGDPWYRPIEEGEAGHSLILARTAKGKAAVESAAGSGYLRVSRAEPTILPASQPNLLRTRGALWGRLLACRLMGVPAPAYTGMPMFRHWWHSLGMVEKFRSVAGTLRRIRSGRESARRD